MIVQWDHINQTASAHQPAYHSPRNTGPTKRKPAASNKTHLPLLGNRIDAKAWVFKLSCKVRQTGQFRVALDNRNQSLDASCDLKTDIGMEIGCSSMHSRSDGTQIGGFLPVVRQEVHAHDRS